MIYARSGAPSGGRTHTGRILSPLPLPLGYRGARSPERPTAQLVQKIGVAP